MAFNNYNTNLGYQGQDLHIIRNGKPFPLNKFFKAQKGVAYNFRFPGTGNTRSYENIQISVTEGNDSTIASITASEYESGGDDKKITNFFVTVYIDGESTKILIHLHDSIEKIWATPNPLTFRKNLAVRFGLYAKFANDCSGDISFYPEFSWHKIDPTLTAVTVDSERNRIVFDPNGTMPATFPKDFMNSFEVTVPEYFRKNQSPTSAKASLQIRDEHGTLKLVLGKHPVSDGNSVDIKNGFNVLFMADGFDGEDKADATTFNEYVTKIRDQMKSKISEPFNLFNDFNFWAYYHESREPMGILRGEYIKIQENNNKAIMVPVNLFIEILDDIIVKGTGQYTYSNNSDAPLEEFKKGKTDKYGSTLVNYIPFSEMGSDNALFPTLKTPSGDGHILKLSELCESVGLPSIDDKNATISTMKEIWTSLGLTNSPRSIKFPGDTVITSTDFFLHSFVFESWKKLSNRVVIDMPDTAFGICRGYSERPIEGFLPSIKMDYDQTKFGDWNDYGKYISAIKYPDSESGQKFGNQFFNVDGSPVFEDNNDVEVVGEKTITTKNVKSGNNIINLSRVPLLRLKGLNSHLTTIDSTGVNSETKYTQHRVIISLHPENFYVTECDIVAEDNTIGKPKSYKLKNVKIRSLKAKVSNAAIHEFAHNYLLDEYTKAANDLGIQPESIQISETEYFSQSNIQTKWSLLDVKDLGDGKIVGDNIKWLWPRISKIGVAIKDLIPAGTANHFIIELKEGSSVFEEEENLLLRRKKLFGASHILCSITHKDQNNPNILTLKPRNGDIINVEDFKVGSVLILPYWTDASHIEYQELVHPKIKMRITNLHEALVPEDENPGTFTKQEATVKHNGDIPNMPGKDPVRYFGRDKSRIVGLYAGAIGNHFPFNYSKGAYHPTGFCIMRDTDNENKPNYFCHVCQYILVDAIDPLQHIKIDIDYNRDYPNI